jgi:uncharacterized cupin superfamily protein
MSTRILGTSLLTGPLLHEPLTGDEVVAGAPTAAIVPVGSLTSAEGVEVGVWEMSEGTARDTEVDEIFVVLSGEGQVEFADGETVALRPGVAVRLQAGESTVWTVHLTLRKLYVAC